MTSLNYDIPSGHLHLSLLEVSGQQITLEKANSPVPETSLAFIGTAMCALYQAATCHRKCWATGHLLESLCGRAYNLTASALLLANRAYYDEALNLIRGLGEIANPISLSAADKVSFQRWLDADEKVRKREFSPVKVRLLLEKSAPDLLCATEEWYSQLCNDYTHVTPNTRPNVHNDPGRSCVGGIYQEEGHKKVLEQLKYAIGFTALQICAYFEFDDLFKELKSLLVQDTTSHAG